MSSYEARGPVQLVWRTASYCQSGECIQVAQQDGLIILRDSTRPDGITLTCASEEWRSLVRHIRAGGFDDL